MGDGVFVNVAVGVKVGVGVKAAVGVRVTVGAGVYAMRQFLPLFLETRSGIIVPYELSTGL